MTSQHKPGTVHVIMGGQYGSEGKGEFTPYFTKLAGARHVVRTGGPNAGHSFTTGLGTFKMRQLPTPWMVNIDPHPLPPVLYIGPGSLINVQVLMDELVMVSKYAHKHGLRLPSIYIDQSAVIIDERVHAGHEQSMGMRQSIGSTTEGIGAARAEHILRVSSLQFATDWWEGRVGGLRDAGNLGGWCLSDEPESKDHLDDRPMLAVTSVAEKLDQALHYFGEDVVIESTQGFGLSLVHSGHYPYATSRDVTPGIILNDAGLSSREDHLVYAVVRTMPIRVAGNSGPLAHETTWEELIDEIDHLEEPERTTVTRNPRRIARELDFKMLERMVRLCRPDGFCLTFADYIAPRLHGCKDIIKIRAAIGDYIDEIEERLGVPVRWVSTGPGCITEY